MTDFYPDVQSLNPDDLLMLEQAFDRNNHIDMEMCERLGVKRGLRNADGTGVLAGLTNICDVRGYVRDQEGKVQPAEGQLVYRGIDLNDLVKEAVEKDRFMFEETAWLLMFGDLPGPEQLDHFKKILEGHRELPDGFAETMIMSAPSQSIMNKMSRSVLAMYSYDDLAEDISLENIIRQSVNLIAQLPTMMIYAWQAKRHVFEHKSMYFHYPVQGLSTAEHILNIYRPDQQFTHEEAKLLDLCMICHADHGGGNCSAFADRVLSSSGTDTYSAISAAIGCLKGPRHGGANLKCMRQLDACMENIRDVKNEEEVLAYLKKILKKEAGDGSGLIYGMGHAVYTLSDPRAQILKEQSRRLAFETGYEKEWTLLTQIEKLTPQAVYEVKGTMKTVCANVDLFSGLIYRMLGIAEDLYTPLFAIARCPGWCAHRMEEVAVANRIIRPAYRYVGEDRSYTEPEER